MKRKLKIREWLLGILLVIIGLNAIGGGIYGIAGAQEVPLQWLDGSPFNTYLLPSIFLLVVVGGSCFASAVLLFRRHSFAARASLFTSLLLLSWISAQIAFIGYVSWLQPAIAIAAVIIWLLASPLRDIRTRQ